MHVLEWNRAASRRIYASMPWANPSPFEMYRTTLVEHFKTCKPATVLELGPGKRSMFEDCSGIGQLIKLDISSKELGDSGNRIVSRAEKLPLADNSVDVICSRSVLEHLDDVAAFLRESQRILKPGGLTIHLCPSKYSSFAMLNQLISHDLKRILLHSLKPGSDGICGFPAKYVDCYASAMKAAIRKSGLSLVKLEASFCQSDYFEFFLPVFLLSVLYEAIVRKIHQNLAGYLFFIAQKT